MWDYRTSRGHRYSDHWISCDQKYKGKYPLGNPDHWLLGILCQLTGLYQPNAELGFYSLLPDFSNGLAIPSLSPIFGKLEFSGIFSLEFLVVIFAFYL